MIKGSSTTLTELSPVSTYALNDRGRSFQGLYTTAQSNDFGNKTYFLKYGHLFRGYAPIGTRFSTIEKHLSLSCAANDNSPAEDSPGGRHRVDGDGWCSCPSRERAMPKSASRSRISNGILSRLSREDFALLEPNLEAVDLPVRKSLEMRKRRIDQVYFIEAGFASVVANGTSKPSIEVGIIGREGMTGLAIVLGNDRAQHATYIQVGGTGLRVSASNLRKAIDGSATLHRSMLHYAHAFLRQTTTTALANGRSKIEERLARWLLMADDRIDGEELPLTHEFLGLMLGTHRPGVTIALQALERKRLITTRRAGITILNRIALEKNSNGTYVPPDG
jgi:CRP-like cAMP-binding protein